MIRRILALPVVIEKWVNLKILNIY